MVSKRNVRMSAALLFSALTLMGCKLPGSSAGGGIRGEGPISTALSAGEKADTQAEAACWALLIGVDHYDDSEMGSLRFCGADMRGLSARLQTGGYPGDHIHLLCSSQMAADRQPTRDNIQKHLTDLLRRVTDRDQVVIAFSGHGLGFDGRSYLCPQDARRGDPGTLIPLQSVYDSLKDCKAASRIVLVDACRNEVRLGGEKGVDSSARTTSFAESLSPAPPGIFMLTSCAPGQVSWEDEQLGHGVFMHFVLQGLQGKADSSHDGNVTSLELAAYASDYTKSYVSMKFKRTQTPFFEGKSTDVKITGMGGWGSSGMPDPALPHLDPGAQEQIPQGFANSLDMQLVRIPAGNFRMGSAAGDADAAACEKPAHLVKISRAFYLARHEVTRGQFRKFVSEANYRTEAERRPKYLSLAAGASDTWLDPGFTQTDEDPVVCVTWNDADAFCGWLSRKEARAYRLPTEAEWEYACRAGSETSYCCGSTAYVLDGYAWWLSNSKEAATHPVGRKSPNARGLFDMHGNVSEWCADWYQDAYYATSPAQDPLGPATGVYRVARGGWFHAPTAASCRSAKRYAHKPTACYNGLGFRVASE